MTLASLRDQCCEDNTFELGTVLPLKLFAFFAVPLSF